MGRGCGVTCLQAVAQKLRALCTSVCPRVPPVAMYTDGCGAGFNERGVTTLNKWSDCTKRILGRRLKT